MQQLTNKVIDFSAQEVQQQMFRLQPTSAQQEWTVCLFSEDLWFMLLLHYSYSLYLLKQTSMISDFTKTMWGCTARNEQTSTSFISDQNVW